MKKSYIIAAASVFAAGALATATQAQTTNKCYGINACKGQGMTVTGTSLECVAQGGSAMP